MGSFAKLKQLLEEKESFVLVCHVEPDGDAIGSLVALGESLMEKNKKVTLISKDPIPAVFDFMAENQAFEHSIAKSCDAVILLDNGDFRRTGFVDELKNMQKGNIPIANIDHHPKNDLWKFVNINYADETASSTCEIIYRILIGLNFEITPRIATCLLAGIFYDTGGFRHSNTSKEVFEIISDLLKHGGKLKKVAENIASNHSVSMLKLWGIALNRLTFNKELGLSVSILRQQDLIDSGANEDEVSGLVNLLNSAPESRAALLLYETKDAKIKGSLRTEKEDVDVAKLAQILGGGGHRKAAGFMIEGRINKTDRGWEIR